jgi:hypothetical protein
MSHGPSIEQRLAALEAAVAELQRQVGTPKPAPNWIEQITGLLKDEPDFQKVLAYGRAIRAADRPAEESEE